jgi:protein-tyrosine phosphatase
MAIESNGSLIAHHHHTWSPGQTHARRIYATNATEVPVSRVLFLCTGNYYRSRFAEELWNHMERRVPSGWQATSRGLCIALGLGNVGPVSHHALRGLRARGIGLAEPIRAPLQVEGGDFTASARVIAMSRSEHRKMVTDQFPALADAVEYWDIDDVDLCAPEAALAKLDERVRALRSELSPRTSPR